MTPNKMTIRKLASSGDCTFTAAYDPPDVKSLFDTTSKDVDITVYPPPLFIMSPRIRVYDAKSIKSYKGHLHSFNPLTIPAGEDGEPEMQVTIKVITNELPGKN